MCEYIHPVTKHKSGLKLLETNWYKLFLSQCVSRDMYSEENIYQILNDVIGIDVDAGDFKSSHWSELPGVMTLSLDAKIDVKLRQKYGKLIAEQYNRYGIMVVVNIDDTTANTSNTTATIMFLDMMM
jgi:hypothetical protein